MKAMAAGGLVLLVLVLGCVSLDSSQKLLCQQKASYAYTSIPKCETLEECYGKTSGITWEEEKTLPSITRDKFNEYRNNAAKAWLYYNKATKTLDSIKQICSGGTGNLAEQTNKAVFELSKTMQCTENAVENSIAVLALEEAWLEEENIGMVPEEELFEAYAEIVESLNNNSAAKYVERKEKAQKNFSLLVQRTGFAEKFEAEKTVKEATGYYGTELLNKIRSQNIVVPLLKGAVGAVAQNITGTEKTQNALKALETISAEETSQAIELFMGQKNSVHQAFVELVEKDARARKALLERNKELEEEAKKQAAKVKEKIKEVKQGMQKYSEVDQNFLKNLVDGLGENTIIKRQQMFTDFKEFGENATQKAVEIEAKLFKEEETLGEWVKKVKDAGKEAAELEESTEYISSDFLEETREACKKKLEAILEKENPEKYSETFELMLYRIKLFRDSGDLKQCQKALELYEQWKQENENFEGFEKEKILEQEKCIEEARELARAFGWLEEREALNLLEEKAKHEIVLEECKKVKERIEEAVAGEKGVKEAKEAITEMGKELEKLKTVAEYCESCRKKTFIAEMEEKNSALAEKIVLDNIAEHAEELEEIGEEAKKLGEQIEKEELGCLEKVLLETKKTQAIAENPIAGKRTQITTIECYYSPISTEHAIILEERVIEGLDAGWKCFETKTEQIFGEVVEKGEKTVFENEEKTVIEKTIVVKTEPGTQKIVVITSIPENSVNEKAFAGAELLDAKKSGGALEIILEEPGGQEEIKVYYEVLKEGVVEEEKIAGGGAVEIVEEPKMHITEIFEEFNELNEKAKKIGIELEEMKNFVENNGEINIEKARKEFEEKTKQKAEQLGKEIKEFRESKEKAEQLVGELKKMLEGTSEKELLEIGVLLPITEKEVEQKEKRANQLYTTSIEKQIKEIEELAESGEYYKAIEKSEKIVENLEKNSAEMVGIAEELEAGKEELQKTAEDKLKEMQEKEAVQQKDKFGYLLEKAQKELEDKKYGQAIKYAQYAGFLTQPTQNSLDLPITIVPLAGIIITAIIWKKKRQQKEQEKKQRAKKVEKWKEE